MSRIYALIGKSASGKDSLYKGLLEEPGLSLRTVVSYTTRPIREGETEGAEYHFVTRERLLELERQGKVIECRRYRTMHGEWCYFTPEDGQIDLTRGSFLLITTLEGYDKLCQHYGGESVVPLYVEVEDGLRLERAVRRERGEKEPKYAELCRRFLSDSEDFSEEKIRRHGIRKRYENIDFGLCLSQIIADIKSEEMANGGISPKTGGEAGAKKDGEAGTKKDGECGTKTDGEGEAKKDSEAGTKKDGETGAKTDGEGRAKTDSDAGAKGGEGAPG